MRAWKLTTRQELDEFHDRYLEAAEFDLSPDFLRTSEVYGVFFDDELSGGFVIRTGPPWRYLNMGWIPASAKEEWEARLSDLQQRGYNIVEISCVWFDRRFTGTWRSAPFWWFILNTAGSRGAETQVLMGTVQRSLLRDYRAVMPPVPPSYEGPVAPDGHEYGWGWVGIGPLPGRARRAYRMALVLVARKRRQARRGRAPGTRA